MLRFACSLALAACFPLPVVADIAPPPPGPGFKRVPLEHVVKLETELPEYKFYTYHQYGIGGEETIDKELNLGTEQGVAVPGSSSPSVRTGVIAVPQTVMEELGTKENLAKLLSRDNKEELPAGVVVHETSGTFRDLKKSDPRTKVENVITISTDEKAGVKFTAKETPAPTGQDAAPEASARSPLAVSIAGIAATLGIVGLGLWCFRRK